MTDRVVAGNIDPSEPIAIHPDVAPARTRIAGALLAAGSTAWAAGTVIVGDKIQEGIQTLDTITGMLFVVGVFAFVNLVRVTRGAGDGWTRIIPAGMLALLSGAFVFNALSFGYVSHEALPVPMMVLDVCWPLSQLGMLVLGITIAIKGRYQGVLRWLPLLAGAWFPVSMAAQILGGSAFSVYVSAAWLLGVHAHLGLRLALRPGL